MSDEPSQITSVTKKLNLQEAIQLKLAQKKQNQKATQNRDNYTTATKGLKSQQTKKANNQKKRTGV
ncbi:hypothetical protein [Bacillus sp. 1P06AnD]|uniref:hypothetical protein n=1 Tax=Bacillus sp. 1P06AnD TaxID=3132208 RepID=UPI0039A0104C